PVAPAEATGPSRAGPARAAVRGTGTARFLAGAARANAVTGGNAPRPAARSVLDGAPPPGPPPFQRVATLPQVAPEHAPVIHR
ncbi:hypothetical protein HCN56_22400, partial [Streptomyces lonarensis]|nr:hypothetical protein [Streptomyces lonarensis]